MIHVRVIAVDGNLITFEAQFRDDHETIGEAQHRRVVVDIERFMKRVLAKSNANLDEA